MVVVHAANILQHKGLQPASERAIPRAPQGIAYISYLPLAGFFTQNFWGLDFTSHRFVGRA